MRRSSPHDERGVALVLCPAEPQILKQLRKAVALNEEDKRERAVRAAAANLAEGSADQGGDAGRLDALREVRRLAVLACAAAGTRGLAVAFAVTGPRLSD